jgi:nitrite reductase (NO-forming)
MIPFSNPNMRLARNPSRSTSLRSGIGTVETRVVVGSAALLAWGGLYVGRYSGRFDADEFDELPHARAPKVVAVAADPNAAVIKAGQGAYGKSCVACHQADGMGNPGLNIPPLAGSDWIMESSPTRIIRIVLHGLGGPVKVKDTMYTGGAMNPWLKTPDNTAGLTPEEIAAALSYARNSWGNKASIVTADQVNAVLKETEKRSDPWTRDELMKVPLASGASATAALTPDQLKAALKGLSAAELEAVLKDLKK